MPTPSTARMHDFEVVSNREIADGIFSLVISAPKLASALKPGQFVNIAVPGDASSLLRVPLSYYRADAQAHPHAALVPSGVAAPVGAGP